MPWFFWVFLVVAMLVPFFIVFVRARKQLGAKRATRRFLILLPFMFIPLGVVFGMFRLLPPIDRNSRLEIVQNRFALIEIVLGVLIWSLTLYQWRRRQRAEAQAGAVLLDLGPLQPRWVFGLFGISFALILVSSVIFIFLSHVRLYGVAQLFMFSGIFSTNLLQRSVRRQVREHGLMLSGELLRWEKIKSYGWAADKPNVLTLELRKPNRWLGQPLIPIPPASRDQVDALLAQHVS